jgi:hypothetical protein
MGLIGGMARTAVVAGTATAVSNRVSRRQAGWWASQDQQSYQQEAYPPQAYEQQAAPLPPPPPAPAQTGMLEQLKKLAELKAAGVLTEDEFTAQKARILAG